jgi:hypothetical protein
LRPFSPVRPLDAHEADSGRRRESDVASAAHLPRSHASSSKVNGKLEIDSITVDDLIAEASKWPMSNRRALLTVAETLRNMRAALTDLDPGRYPGMPTVALEIVRDRTRHLISWLPSDATTAARGQR